MQVMSRYLTALCLLIFSSSAFGLQVPQQQPKVINVNDLIELAKRDSELIKATEKSLESLEAEIKSRDLVLTANVTADLAMFNDHLETMSVSNTNRDNSGLLDLTLTKPFSTGTKFTLNVTHDLLHSENFTGERNVAGWKATLSQALWRDSFGRENRLRRSAEQSELLSRRYQILFDRQQFLVNLENAFWDYTFALREIALRNETIDRSTALEKWVRQRIGKYAAEGSDLLQVKALVSQRQLDLSAAKNRLETAMNTIRGYIPSVDPVTWQPDLNSFEKDRSPTSLLAGGSTSPASPVRLDALSSNFKVAQSKTEAERVADNLKPQLDAYVSYGANGIDEHTSSSWSEASRREHDATRVGVLLSIDLDQSLKNQKRKAAQLSAEAEAYRAATLSRQSNLGWSDLIRSIENLREQVKESKELADLQNRKAKLERRRYEQGRTTVLQITTYEVDAAQSELRFYEVLSQLRKAESLARLFTVAESK